METLKDLSKGRRSGGLLLRSRLCRAAVPSNYPDYRPHRYARQRHPSREHGCGEQETPAAQ